MRNYLFAGVAAVALSGVGFVAPQANATAITTNVWYEFSFDTASGSPLAGCAGVGCTPAVNPPDGHPIVLVGSPAWTINSAVPLTLYVQDLFGAVDQFDMFNNAGNLGLTSADANNPGINCGADITACIASLGNSRGTFTLPAGADSITGTRLCITCVNGASVFELTSAVPEPSTLSVLGAALLALAVGLGLVRRRGATPGPVA